MDFNRSLFDCGRGWHSTLASMAANNRFNCPDNFEFREPLLAAISTFTFTCFGSCLLQQMRSLLLLKGSKSIGEHPVYFIIIQKSGFSATLLLRKIHTKTVTSGETLWNSLVLILGLIVDNGHRVGLDFIGVWGFGGRLGRVAGQRVGLDFIGVSGLWRAAGRVAGQRVGLDFVGSRGFGGRSARSSEPVSWP